MTTYPTDEMIVAALQYLDQRAEGSRAPEMVREMLIAADRAAWRPISEAPTDGQTRALVHWIDKSGESCMDGFWLCNYDNDETHIRPLPLPPLTPAESAPKARFVAAGVPASPADVLPSGDAG